MKIKTYTFEDIIQCEMCGDDTKNHRILGQRMNRSQGLSPKKKKGITVSIMECNNCGLIYPQPLPIPSNIQDHYDTPADNYWSSDYFQMSPDYFSSQIEIAKNILPSSSNMTALDIGAGIGKCMYALQNSGFDAHGIEPSKSFYDQAISKVGISPEKLKLGTIEEIEFPDNSFDFITYGAVFEHIYHPRISLEKVQRWLKPGGIIHLEVPSANYLISKFINIFFKLRGTNYVTNLSPMHSPFHLYEFSIKSFEAAGKTMNFEIAQYQYDVWGLLHVPRIIHPLLKWYMGKTDTGMQLTLFLRNKI